MNSFTSVFYCLSQRPARTLQYYIRCTSCASTPIVPPFPMVTSKVIELGEARVGRISLTAPARCKRDGLIFSIEVNKNGRLKKIVLSACGPDGKVIVSAENGILVLIDCLTSEYVEVCQLDLIPVAVEWSSNGSHVLVSGARGELAFVRLSDGTTSMYIPPVTEAPIVRMSFEPSGQHFVSSSTDGCVIWEVAGNQIKRIRKLQGGRVTEAVFIGRDKLAMSLSKARVLVWNWPHLQQVATYMVPTIIYQTSSMTDIELRSLKVSADNTQLLAVDTTGHIYVWNVMDSNDVFIESVLTLSSNHSIHDVAFITGSKTISLISSDGTVRLVGVVDGAVLCRIGVPQDQANEFEPSFNCMSVSVDSAYIAVVSNAGRVYVYDTSQLIAHGGNGSDYRELQPQTHSQWHTPQQIQRGPSSRHNRQMLQRTINQAGQFPVDSRSSIWSFLLELPCQIFLFNGLQSQGIHSSCANIHTQYVFSSIADAKRLQMIVSAMVHWEPCLEDLAKSLFPIVYPLLHVYPESDNKVFETALVFMDNWCNGWLDYAPNPPTGTVLKAVDKLLAMHDDDLYSHFRKYNISALIWAWPMLQGIFAGVLSALQWAALWDNLILESTPRLVYYVTVAMVRCDRRRLLTMNTVMEIETLCQAERALDVDAVLRSARHMCSKTHRDNCPSVLMGLAPDVFRPLSLNTKSKDEDYLPIAAQRYTAIRRVPGLGNAKESFNLNDIINDLSTRDLQDWNRDGGAKFVTQTELVSNKSQMLSEQRTRLSRLLNEKENMKVDIEDDLRELSKKGHNMRQAQMKNEVKAMVTMLDVASQSMDCEISREVEEVQALIAKRTAAYEEEEQEMRAELEAREARLEVERVTFNEVWERIKRDNKNEIHTALQLATDKNKALHEEAIGNAQATDREIAEKSDQFREHMQRMMLQTHGNDLKRRVKAELQKYELEQHKRRLELSRRLKMAALKEDEHRTAALELLYTEERNQADSKENGIRVQAIDARTEALKNERTRLNDLAERTKRQNILKLEIRREKLKQMQRGLDSSQFDAELQSMIDAEVEAARAEERAIYVGAAGAGHGATSVDNGSPEEF
eukprot:CFRG5232T1